MSVRSTTIVVLLLLSPLTAASQELPFVHYTTESARNPLPSAAVTGVYQDRLGYIWFSVYSTGLVRYDGGTMATYAADDGLRDLGVYRLIEGADGRLWVASRGGIVVSDRPLDQYEIGERVRFAARLGETDLPTGHVNTNAITTDVGGSVWAGAAEAGLVRLTADPSGILARTLPEPYAAALGAITAVAGRQDGSVWAANLDGEVHVVSPDSLRAVPLEDRLANGSHFSVLFEASSGTLWAGTNEGTLLRLRDTTDGPRFEHASTSLGVVITTICEGPDGSLWIGSEGSGVLRFDPESGHERLYDFRHGLLGTTTHQITVDAEGNVWFAQLGGASKLRFNFEAFRNYSAVSHRGEPPILPSAAVGAVALAGNDGAPCPMWAATSEGGIACIRSNGTSEVLQAHRGLRSDWVNALALDAEGRLWIGTQAGIQSLAFEPARGLPGAPMRAVDVGGRTAYVSGYGPSQVAVFTISVAHMPISAGHPRTVESVWFGGWDLFSLVDGQWFIFGSPSGLPRTRLHAVAFDGDGRLWVSTQGEGIFRSRSPVTLASLSEEDQEPIDLPTPEGGRLHARVLNAPLFEQIAVDVQGHALTEVYRLLWVGRTMWAATAEGMVALRARTEHPADSVEVVARLGREHGLGADFTMSLAYAPQTETIWVGTNGGLSEVDPDRSVVIRTLSTQDGLIGNEAWYTGSVAVGPDGSVYYGTARGLSIYHPFRDAKDMNPPRIRLRAARFAAARGNNEFAAEYAALGFAEESRIRYRTRLVGYDSDWSAEVADDRIRYTNLPAMFISRAYTLEIQARNSSGTWTTDPLRYRFDVPPPPWLQWWAVGLYALALGATVFGIQRVQRSRLTRKERARAQIREAELAAETALARSSATEAQARALQEENKRKEAELEKARELEKAYHALKVTQAQLIQSEKLASLGQLTAGIAHEIKNPLNFVTNFAALTREIANELIEKSAAESSLRLSDVHDDLELIQMNSGKIEEHGLRADGIVRSMLQHSRGDPGDRQPTDVNAIVEQYVALAYHGERARIPGFEPQIERSYAPDVGTVELVQQEFGRVILNLLDNAFYAVLQRSSTSNGLHTPTVRVTTRRLRGQVEIRVQDNGSGIPAGVREKIFEPFFTTKPTGEGTGLGLSLSHNIIVQGCGGEFEVESTEGEGTTFVIRLPQPDKEEPT